MGAFFQQSCPLLICYFDIWQGLLSSYSRLSVGGTENITGNTVKKGGFGPDVASAANMLRLTSALTANGLLAEDHLGGTPLPTIILDVLDSFGQRISAGIEDSGGCFCCKDIWLFLSNLCELGDKTSMAFPCFRN